MKHPLGFVSVGGCPKGGENVGGRPTQSPWITVRRWIERFNQGGVVSLADDPRMGRPPTYTREQVGELIATALTDPKQIECDPPLPFGAWTLERLATYLKEHRDIPVSPS
jgi:transposase